MSRSSARSSRGNSVPNALRASILSAADLVYAGARASAGIAATRGAANCVAATRCAGTCGRCGGASQGGITAAGASMDIVPAKLMRGRATAQSRKLWITDAVERRSSRCEQRSARCSRSRTDITAHPRRHHPAAPRPHRKVAARKDIFYAYSHAHRGARIDSRGDGAYDRRHKPRQN